MVLACVLFCVSCASAPAEQPADAEDTAKAFLTAFYTADEEGRYTEFLSATEGGVFRRNAGRGCGCVPCVAR